MNDQITGFVKGCQVANYRMVTVIDIFPLPSPLLPSFLLPFPVHVFCFFFFPCMYLCVPYASAPGVPGGRKKVLDAMDWSSGGCELPCGPFCSWSPGCVFSPHCSALVQPGPLFPPMTWVFLLGSVDNQATVLGSLGQQFILQLRHRRGEV